MPDANCKICGGTGWKIVERAGLSGADRCECSYATRNLAIKENSRIPPKYQQASFDNFKIPQDNAHARQHLGGALMQVRSFVREYPSSDKPGLLLVGDNGTGKTHLAVAALRALLDKGHEGVFFDYPSLLQRIIQSFDVASGSSLREAYREALEAPILLLDELGAYKMTEFVEDTITAIITDRCNSGKTLIATTNLPDPDVTGEVFQYSDPSRMKIARRTLAEVIGPRARSRLFEMCRVVQMNSSVDYRVKTGQVHPKPQK
jgi:DNA replication protein DnaC